MTTNRTVAPVIAAIVLFLPVLYVLSYLAIVNPPQGRVRPLTVDQFLLGGENYRCGGNKAESFFWPLEQIDRKLRPDAWIIWCPPGPEFQLK